MNGRSLLFAVPGLVLAGILGYGVVRWAGLNDGLEVVEKIGYHSPHAAADEVLTDDRLQDKTPKFDPSLVDRRPLGDWQVNLSAAVIKLDLLALKPDVERDLLVLHRSYQAAIETGRKHYLNVLPSVNLIDGKAKQFDDGLYAALDAAYYQGLTDRLQSHVGLIRRLYEKVGKDSPASPFLAAGLELAGVRVEVVDAAGQAEWLRQFRANEVTSKPTGFYTWNQTLSDCFRFLRFFQHEFPTGEMKVPLALAQAFAGDETLLADYRRALAFYAKLTNPYVCFSVADLVGVSAGHAEHLTKLARGRRVTHQAVALLPPSTARETVLFEKLFPLGLPPNADLMKELVRRIRSGEVDLKPRPESGWYEYQVYALETLLLPEKGAEHAKLLLTKAYKKRMLEAFQGLITKRRETHVRQMAVAATKSTGHQKIVEPEVLKPRLRVEPCPSYYVRTARAYAFLANFLETAVGKEALQSLHGLRAEGEREENLYRELAWMRDLFYGLCLVSAEDIGSAPELTKDEPVDRERCYALATTWLAGALRDRDLAADTRVSVPIVMDTNRQVVRLWVTLGVRLAKLEVEYAKPPHIRPLKEPGEWKPLESHRTASAHFLIPVEEFAEVELPGLKTLTREELRAVCDREKTKDAIVAALRAKR